MDEFWKAEDSGIPLVGETNQPDHHDRAKRNAAMLKVVPMKSEMRQDFELSLDEIAREGARRMLMHALNQEVEEYIQSHKDQVDEQGRRLVVRNGVSKSRTVTIGSGSVKIQAPRVNDRREGRNFFPLFCHPIYESHRRWNLCCQFYIWKVFLRMIFNQRWVSF